MNTMDKVDLALGTFFIAFSLTDVYNIISIVILCLQVVYFVVRLVLRIRDRIKSKEYDKIDDDIKETAESIESLIPKDEGKEDGDGKE